MLEVIFLIFIWSGAYKDIKERKIPNGIVAGVFLVAIVSFLWQAGPGIRSQVLGIFVVSVPMLLVTLARPGSFGGGDVKLMAAGGAFLGAADIFTAFFYSLVMGSVYGIGLMLFQKKEGKTQIAFGPFLAAGMTIKLIVARWIL